MMARLYEEITGPESSMTSPLNVSLESHFMAFAAEKARVDKKVVPLS